jgi:hypothetical protein
MAAVYGNVPSEPFSVNELFRLSGVMSHYALSDSEEMARETVKDDPVAFTW